MIQLVSLVFTIRYCMSGSEKLHVLKSKGNLDDVKEQGIKQDKVIDGTELCLIRGQGELYRVDSKRGDLQTG